MQLRPIEDQPRRHSIFPWYHGTAECRDTTTCSLRIHFHIGPAPKYWKDSVDVEFFPNHICNVALHTEATAFRVLINVLQPFYYSLNLNLNYYFQLVPNSLREREIRDITVKYLNGVYPDAYSAAKEMICRQTTFEISLGRAVSLLPSSISSFLIALLFSHSLKLSQINNAQINK